MRKLSIALVALLVACAKPVTPPTTPTARGKPIIPATWTLKSRPVTASHAMVVTAHPLATEAGVAILKQGGNAIDAAVAVAFALEVVLPDAGNIGGGGFIVHRTAGGEVHALDYREAAQRGVADHVRRLGRQCHRQESDRPSRRGSTWERRGPPRGMEEVRLLALGDVDRTRDSSRRRSRHRYRAQPFDRLGP
jgi:gamma-glutamyltranspeptidase